MKKSKLFTLGLSFVLASAGLLSVGIHNETKSARADAVTISNLDEFKTVFNKGADYYNRDIELLADIDVSTYLNEVNAGGACGMAGDYTGTFNGNGHRIYGAVSTGGADHGILFNIVSGTVKNLILDWTHEDGNSNGGLCYAPNGTFENVTIITRAEGGNTFGAFGRNANGGTFTNCNAHFIVGSANTFQFVASITAKLTVTNCYYSTSNGSDITDNGATKVTLGNVDGDDMELEPSEEANLGGLYGLPMTWVSSDNNIATVSGNTVTGVAEGNCTLTGTVAAPYSTDFGAYTKTIDLSVTSTITPLSSISLNHTSETLFEGQSLSLTATPDTNGYDSESIEWTVSNNSYLSVTGSGLSVTVNALAAAVSQTVTIRITSSNSTVVSATCTITISEATRLNVYFAVKQGFVNLGSDGYALWLYGGGATESAHALVDTGYDVTIDSVACDLYLARINMISANAMSGNNIKAGVYVQLAGGVNTGARWGVGAPVSSLDGYVFTIDNWASGGSAVTNLGTAEDMADVLDFCVDSMKAETISLDNHSSTASCEANYSAALTAVAALSDEERLLFTYTAYYARLQAWAVANGETFSIDGDGAIESRSMTLFNNNNNIVIIVVAVSVLSLAVFALIALKRKHN